MKTTCIRCENRTEKTRPFCEGRTHHGYIHGCTCDPCKQLFRAIQAGELTGDESTITEYERSMHASSTRRDGTRLNQEGGTIMQRYQLFSEWADARLYGETLADAVTRARTLSRPRRYEDGVLVRGEVITISRVIQSIDTSRHTRGGHKYQSLLVETDEGKYVDVDAIASSLD